jgi:mono/diheme cytochrome c family protein
LLGLVAAIYVALALVYYQATDIIEQRYPAEQRNVPTSELPAVIAEGERLALAYGCFRGCHGSTMQGAVMFEGPLLGRMVAPNLSEAAERYSVSELEAIVRQGVKPDGTSVFGMPSSRYAIMTDREFSAIVSFIRSYPRQVGDPGHSRFGLLERWRLLSRIWIPEAERRVEDPWPPGFEADQLRYGEYLSMNACDQCHADDYRTFRGWSPNLTAAKGYDRWEFQRLMREGMGLSGLEVGQMSAVARVRFSGLEDAEIDALYAYLLTLP